MQGNNRDRDQDYFDCEDQLEKEIGKNASPLGYFFYPTDSPTLSL